MPEVIEACLSNVDSGDLPTERDVTVHPCLEHCGICYLDSFLVLDGELETGASHTEILEGCVDS